MYASIDRMSDKLERQVKRYRGRQIDRWHGQMKNSHVEPPIEPEPFVVEEEEEARIVRNWAVPDEADERGGGGPPDGAPRPRLLRLTSADTAT